MSDTEEPDDSSLFESSGSLDDGEEQDSEVDADVDRYWPPPMDDSLKLVASGLGKIVSAFAFNHAGTRFAAGGHEFEVRIWDFQALDRDQPEPINCVQPSGQTVIKQLEFSPDDQLILVISGGCQATIIGKDGTTNKSNQMVCPKGDQYIADMARTKGHVQMLNDGCWNPKDKSNFLTCSNDATIRLWDLNKLDQQKTVIKTRSPGTGLKAVPTVSKYSRDSLSIIAGCNDGSIMIWDARRKFFSTSSCIKEAHSKGSEITGLDYCYGGNRICSRSEDETCKVWDLRQLKQPTAVKSGLATMHNASDCSFSPDDKYVLIGTSAVSGKSGQLHFLDANHLETQMSIDVDDASVIRVRWHPKINHIGYSCSDGRVVVGCDKVRSIGGLLRADAGRGVKRKKYKPAGGVMDIKKIITPHALPLFREDSTSSSFAKIRQDPKKSYKPEIPISANENGRIKVHGSTLSSYVARNLALAKKTDQTQEDQ
jgi:WD40 repeat protein